MTQKDEKGEVYEFFASIGHELKKVVGTVKEEMSSHEARERGLTTVEKGGKYLLLEVEGKDETYGRFKKDLKKVKKKNAA